MKVIKKQNNLKNKIYSNFKDSWNYVKESRKCIYFSILIFVIFLLIALVFPVPAELAREIKLIIQKLILETRNLNLYDLISFIFINNFSVALLAIFAGIFFCIVPVIIAISNGYVLGYVIKLTLAELGSMNGFFSLWRLLPHGIFELPAIFIGWGVGIKLGLSLINSLNQNSFKIFFKNFWQAIKVIFYIIIPLLVIAAIIEGSLIKF